MSISYGVLYPGVEVFGTPQEIDDWLGCATEAGFDHVVLPDHVLGVDPAGQPEGWGSQWPGNAGGQPPYTHREIFREPLVLFGYMAAKCDLELVTGVMILPQRQTALVAKQAAEADLLSGGKVRLAVGVGWNSAEYEALGVDFHTRGRLMDEQIELLRRLWTQEVVSFEGEFHKVVASGIQQLPIQRPIPLWIGGQAPPVMRRAGRLGDGWFVTGSTGPDEKFVGALQVMRTAAEEAGRDPDQLGVETRLVLRNLDDEGLREQQQAWVSRGATHLCLDTQHGGRNTMKDHLEGIKQAARALF